MNLAEFCSLGVEYVPWLAELGRLQREMRQAGDAGTVVGTEGSRA